MFQKKPHTCEEGGARLRISYWWTLKNTENENFEKMKRKKIAGDTMILHMCTKIHKHMRYSSWDMEWDKICHFRLFFAILPQYWPQKLNFGKNVKNTWRYYPFTYVYHKWTSYDAWFLRYKVQRTASFVILGHFLSFDPPNNLKHQNFEKMK